MFSFVVSVIFEKVCVIGLNSRNLRAVTEIGYLQLINVSHKLIDCAYAVGKFIRFFAAIAHGFLGRLAYLAHNLQRIIVLCLLLGNAFL